MKTKNEAKGERKMSREALLTGTAGGIIGTITAGIGAIWGIISIILRITLSSFYANVIFLLIGLISPYKSPFSTLIDILYVLASDPSGLLSLFFMFSFMLSILLIVSCILTGVGFYGVYQAGGSVMGVVGLIFGIIGGAPVVWNFR